MVWMLALALADEPREPGTPPEGIDLDDLGHWEGLVDAGLAGPRGCYSVKGNGEILAKLYTPATMWTRSSERALSMKGPISGILDDGVWFRFKGMAAGEFEGEKVDGIYFTPMAARVGSSFEMGEDGELKEVLRDKVQEQEISLGVGDDGPSMTSALTYMNVAYEIIHGWERGASTSYAMWNSKRDGVEVVRDIPLADVKGNKELVVNAYFPEGGSAMTEMDVTLPNKLKYGEWPLFLTLTNTQIHVRYHLVDGVPMPLAESASGVISFMGFTFGYEQQLTYSSVAKCTKQ